MSKPPVTTWRTPRRPHIDHVRRLDIAIGDRACTAFIEGEFGDVHPNVKVALTSCLTEVTRITAPEAPYDDDVMKVTFVALLGMERCCL